MDSWNLSKMRHTKLHDQVYDGQQLRPLWIAEQTGEYGTAVVTFRGPCSVRDHMVDMEDIRDQAFITSDMMLHYIIEIFDIGLREAVLYQHLFVQNIAASLRPQIKAIVCGDDIMINVAAKKEGGTVIEQRKLSVSIATASVVSGLIHIGLNILNSGTPEEVSTTSLSCWGVNLDNFEMCTRAQISRVYSAVEYAMCKVKTV